HRSDRCQHSFPTRRSSDLNQEEGGNYTATSDQEGHFEIHGIEPGRYQMFAERTGFVEVDQKRRRSRGLYLSFSAGQKLKDQTLQDRKSTRLNSSHVAISYA